MGQWLVLASALAVLSVLSGGSDEPARASVAQADLDPGGYAVRTILRCVPCVRWAGMPGTGVAAGPPVNGVDVAYVDLTLRTGRMPIIEPSVGIVEDPAIQGADREALVAWMADRFDLPGALPAVGEGDAGRGQELYATYCMQCHGADGAGGVAAEGTLVRPVEGVDPVAVVEAIRVGPFQMPRFDEQVLSDEASADIAAYVQHLSDAPTTPLGLGELNRVTMAGLAGALVLALLGVVFLVARPVRLGPPPRAHAEGGQEPVRAER